MVIAPSWYETAGNAISDGAGYISDAVGSGMDYIGQHGEGIGAALSGVGGLAGTYLNYRSGKEANQMAKQQFAQAQAQAQAGELRRRGAQEGMTKGFASSSLALGDNTAPVVDKKKKLLAGGLAGGY